MSDSITPCVSLGKRRYRENEVDENILKRLKEIGEAREKRSKDQRVDDADYFSKQVASILRRLPLRKQVMAKIQIQQMLYNIEFCEESVPPQP